MKEGIYYIETDSTEYSKTINGYFPSEEKAKKAIENCSNHYGNKGSGRIYFIEFGLNKQPVLILNNNW